MIAAIDRTLSVLDLLSRHPAGLSVNGVATHLGLAPAATHRLLNDLLRAEGAAPGCLSIAGPAARLTPARRAALLPALQDAAAQIAAMIPGSGFFRGRG